jgi:hypothetical protein
MRNPLRFFIELNQQRLWVVCWVYYLVIMNFSSAFFWQEPLAKTIFSTFIVSAFSIIALYTRFGFEKIMGLGHVFWVPLLVLLVGQVRDSGGTYRSYLIVMTLSIIVSLVFDTVDVWTYLTRRGSPTGQRRQG